MTLNQLRNLDFIALCRAIAADKLKNGQLATIREILEEAIMTPPKAHYIDFDDAVRMLRRIENTGLRNFTSNELQRDKWIEFHDQVREAMNSRRRLSFLSAVAFVLAFRRPSRFYFSIHTARKIVVDRFAFVPVGRDRG